MPSRRASLTTQSLRITRIESDLVGWRSGVGSGSALLPTRHGKLAPLRSCYPLATDELGAARVDYPLERTSGHQTASATHLHGQVGSTPLMLPTCHRYVRSSSVLPATRCRALRFTTKTGASRGDGSPASGIGRRTGLSSTRSASGWASCRRTPAGTPSPNRS